MEYPLTPHTNMQGPRRPHCTDCNYRNIIADEQTQTAQAMHGFISVQDKVWSTIINFWCGRPSII